MKRTWILVLIPLLLAPLGCMNILTGNFARTGTVLDKMPPPINPDDKSQTSPTPPVTDYEPADLRSSDTRSDTRSESRRTPIRQAQRDDSPRPITEDQLTPENAYRMAEAMSREIAQDENE